MQDTPKEPSSTMLYVSNLPFSFEDSDLKNVFKGYNVQTAYVATRRNGRSKGFGFVSFADPAEQQKAQSALDNTELDGRQLSVKVAHKDERRDERGELREEFKTAPREPRQRRAKEAAPAVEKQPSETVLYVANLPFEFSDDDLRNVFAAHNPVMARIARRRNDRSKGFGFVEFGSHADQQAALKLDGHAIEDRQISVVVSMSPGGERSVASEGQAGAKKERKPKKKAAPAPRAADPQSNEPSETWVYVSNLPFEMTDEQLVQLFKDKGHKAVAAQIARKRDARSKGFGFVEFASNAEQVAALALDGQTLEDRDISVKVAKKGSETRPAGEEGAADAPKRKRNRKKGGADGEARAPVPAREKKPSETLVYVSNLSFDVDDNALAKLFDGLTIKSAHVAVRRNGRSKGFGFVEFASHADQQKALAKSGTELSGRPLTVEIANEKVEDEAQQ